MRKGSVLTVFLLSIWYGYAYAQPPNIYTFNPDVKVTDAVPGDGTSSIFFSSGQHYTAYRGDTVYVVWWESRLSNPPTGNHVFLGKSTDGGATFGPSIRVNDIPAGFNPSMRMDSSGNIYIAYERQSNIWFTKSTDGGNTFSPSIMVVDAAGVDSVQKQPSIAVNDRGLVYIAWIDERTDPGSIFTASSYDSGQTFDQNVRASQGYAIGLSGFDIGADNAGRVFVALTTTSNPANPNQLPIYLARSDDSGQTFQLRGVVTDFPMDTTTAYAWDPSMAVENGMVGVAWDNYQDANYSKIRFSLSNNLGETFLSSVRVDTGYAEEDCVGSAGLSVSSNKGVFYVAWADGRRNPIDSNCLVTAFLSYTSNGAYSFVTELARDTSGGGSYAAPHRPSLAVNEQGKAFVAWIDDRLDPAQGIYQYLFGASATPNFIKGDLNLDGLLTPADVVLELNAVFSGKPFPAPFESADVNCDTQLTPADVVLHLNATFSQEPFPCS